MDDFHTPIPGMKEQRLIRQRPQQPQGISGLEQLSRTTTTPEITSNEFDAWKAHTPGARELFDYFSQKDSGEANIEELRDLVSASQETDPEHILVQIRELFTIIESQDSAPREKVAAERKISILVDYLQARQAVLEEHRKKLFAVRKETKEGLPPVIGGTLNQFKHHVGSFARGFMDASASDKAIMIAGVASAVFAAKKINGWINNKGGPLKDVKDSVSVIVGLGVTGAVVYMGAEAANRAYKRTYGMPLINTSAESALWTSKEAYEKSQSKREFARVYARMRDINIPVDEFPQIQRSGKEKFAFGIANIATLTVKELRDLYVSHLGNVIAEESLLYPRHPFAKDYLTPAERMLLVEDMCKALGLADANGNPLDLTEEQEKKTVLAMSLDRI